MNDEFTKGFEERDTDPVGLYEATTGLMRLCQPLFRTWLESSAGWILSDVLNEFVKNLLGNE